jgi:predicted methyltransferase
MRSTNSALVLVSLAICFGTALAQDAPSYAIPPGTPDNIRLAVMSGERGSEQTSRDALRKPAEILTLAGIDSGDRVIEFASFGHYYTTLLTAAVGPSGHVYMIDMPWTERFGGEGARAFDAAHDNATYIQAHYNQVALPQSVDAVMSVLFYHDLKRESAEESVDTADMNARVFAALRPGGSYLIVDHKADGGSGWRDAGTLHRVDPQTIIDEVTAAGFELVLSSNLLANPGDDHSLNVRDASLRGRTDRAVLLFRKPL